MAGTIKPILLIMSYCLNSAILVCLLGAAFFLSRGLFGDLYTCNQKAVAEVQYIYDTQAWTSSEFCMVDLNYTANPHTRTEQSFYALQVTVACKRMYNSPELNITATTLCYNRFHPEYFASATDTGGFLLFSLSCLTQAGCRPEISQAQSAHEEAIDCLQLGFRASLWMAFFAFLSSGINRNMDRIDSAAMQIQHGSVKTWQYLRTTFSKWRERGRQASSLPDNGTSAAELQTINIAQPTEMTEHRQEDQSQA